MLGFMKQNKGLCDEIEIKWTLIIQDTKGEIYDGTKRGRRNLI